MRLYGIKKYVCSFLRVRPRRCSPATTSIFRPLRNSLSVPVTVTSKSRLETVMTIRSCRYLAFATCAMSILLCARADAQTIVDERDSIKTGPAAVLLSPSSSSVIVATVATGTRVHAQKVQGDWYLVRLPKAADEPAPVSGWIPAAMLSRVRADMGAVGTSGYIEPQARVAPGLSQPARAPDCSTNYDLNAPKSTQRFRRSMESPMRRRCASGATSSIAPSMRLKRSMRVMRSWQPRLGLPRRHLSLLQAPPRARSQPQPPRRCRVRLSAIGAALSVKDS